MALTTAKQSVPVIKGTPAAHEAGSCWSASKKAGLQRNQITVEVRWWERKGDDWGQGWADCVQEGGRFINV